MARQEGFRNLDDAVERNSVALLGGERMVSRLQLDQGGINSARRWTRVFGSISLFLIGHRQVVPRLQA